MPQNNQIIQSDLDTINTFITRYNLTSSSGKKIKQIKITEDDASFQQHLALVEKAGSTHLTEQLLSTNIDEPTRNHFAEELKKFTAAFSALRTHLAAADAQAVKASRRGKVKDKLNKEKYGTFKPDDTYSLPYPSRARDTDNQPPTPRRSAASAAPATPRRSGPDSAAGQPSPPPIKPASRRGPK